MISKYDVNLSYDFKENISDILLFNNDVNYGDIRLSSIFSWYDIDHLMHHKWNNGNYMISLKDNDYCYDISKLDGHVVLRIIDMRLLHENPSIEYNKNNNVFIISEGIIKKYYKIINIFEQHFNVIIPCKNILDIIVSKINGKR